MAVSHCDVGVLGGGPAGATCAAKLAKLGFSVTLFEPGERRRQHRGESLPSSTRTLFEALELSLSPDVIVERPPRHLVYWGELGGPAAPGQEHSFLVWRGRFDEHLRAHACAQGARWNRAAVRDAKTVDDGVELSFDDSSRLTCRMVVDASGRAGVLARRYRRRERGFRTLAVTGHFRTEESSPPTIVESFPDGWVWSAPLENGLRDVTVMLDERADYDETLRRAEHVYPLVDGAARVGAVRGTDATPYTASRFCDGNVILAGDAASFLDPLSAHGVHKAMDSGLVAAIVVRTMLEHPSRASDAAAFHEQRESGIYRATSERLRRLYRQETRFQDRPFWQKRSSGAEAVFEPEPPKIPLRPEMKLAPAPGIDVVEAPVLQGELIEREQVLRVPGRERDVRFLGNVCLPEIFAETVRAESAAAAARTAPAPFDQAYAAIDWLYRSGYLVEDPHAGPNPLPRRPTSSKLHTPPTVDDESDSGA